MSKSVSEQQLAVVDRIFSERNASLNGGKVSQMSYKQCIALPFSNILEVDSIDIIRPSQKTQRTQ